MTARHGKATPGGHFYSANGEPGLSPATRPTIRAPDATSCTGGWNGQLRTPFPATVALGTEPRRTMCGRPRAAASPTVGSDLSSGRGAARSIGHRHFGADSARAANSPRLFHARLHYALRFCGPVSGLGKVPVPVCSRNFVR